MNIEQLVKRQDALIADMTKSLKARGVDAAVIARPIEIQENRADSIKGRIEALENFKRQQEEAINVEIADLKAELDILGKALEKDRKTLAPVIKTTKTKARASKATSAKSKAT